LEEVQVIDTQIISFLDALRTKYIKVKPQDFADIMQIIKEEIRTL
jgi:hypothetical protein